MRDVNLIYNPDHQQVLEHHKELLKKAEQEQFAHLVTAAPKHPLPSFRKLMQHWFSDRRTAKIVQVTSRLPGSRT